MPIRYSYAGVNLYQNNVILVGIRQIGGGVYYRYTGDNLVPLITRLDDILACGECNNDID